MTTTDRQLLTAAATAAGMTVLVEPWHTRPNGWFWCDHGNRGAGMYHAVTHAFWNPLVDDGDALRLVVALRMMLDDIRQGHMEGNIVAVCGGHAAYEPREPDANAATGRAIVIAAATKVDARTVKAVEAAS